MKKTYFKAKPQTKDLASNYDEIFNVDKEGYVHGQLLYSESEAYIVGDLIEATEEYTALEYWCPVIEETITKV